MTVKEKNCMESFMGLLVTLKKYIYSSDYSKMNLQLGGYIIVKGLMEYSARFLAGLPLHRN